MITVTGGLAFRIVSLIINYVSVATTTKYVSVNEISIYGR